MASERMYLEGSDDVRRAASQMQTAAESISRSASQIESALERHQQFLDNWLNRLEAILNAH